MDMATSLVSSVLLLRLAGRDINRQPHIDMENMVTMGTANIRSAVVEL